jgi:hypothetical protein
MTDSSEQAGPLAALLAGATLSVLLLLIFAFVQYA